MKSLSIDLEGEVLREEKFFKEIKSERVGDRCNSKKYGIDDFLMVA